jgi:predicted phosphoribosyltransferase
VSWVGTRFGVSVEGAGETGGMVELALRRNPKRPHLLVSTVLGKHVPTDPRIVHEAGLRLGRAVGAVLATPPALVLGYAETATGLGHCVAEALDAFYLHSTRRAVDAVGTAGAFEELHSHATGHLLLPEDPALLARPESVVLVDDELSTGATALNTIAELQRLCPREQYVIAALVDMRSAADRARVAQRAAELQTSVEVVSLASGAVLLPADFAARAAGVVASYLPPELPHRVPATVAVVPAMWSASVRDGGRHGYAPDDQRAAVEAARAQAAAIQPVRACSCSGPRS